ncbi:MAG: FdtA/QdtA family cupin domain-containing protein [Bacteroidia bacterium]|nr:FdtA/QdtA family cupin domain-containing protein [Bacteroidia bacterium]
MADFERPYLIRFDKIGSTELGYISVAEYGKQVPFRVERVYWTYFTPEEITRGHHAHYTLEQVVVAVSGKLKIELEAVNGERNVFELTKPDQGLFIPKRYWRTLFFEHHSVLLCLASQPFVQEDYIRDREVFRKLNG